MARAGYANAYLAYAFFSGNAADMTNAVFFVGRNIDSGTRLTAQAETGIGANSSVQQCEIISNTAVLYPAGVVNGISVVLGNNGYTSTGSLLGAVETVLPTGTGADPGGIASGDNTGTNYVIGYAGASKIGTAGTEVLSYNGTPYTLANMENGQYTFWGYEHMLLSPYYADAGASNVYSSVATLLKGLTTAQLGSGNASLTDMVNVTRSADGGVVSQNY